MNSDNDSINSLHGDNVTNSYDFSKKPSNDFASFFSETIETIITTVVILLVLNFWVAFPEVVSGASMEPGITNGERIYVERLTKHFSGFSRGDIVVLNPPGNDREDYIKRIIALPGEIINISDCEILITSTAQKFKLDEPYLADGVCTQGGNSIKEGRALKLKDNEYVLLGDNRPRSVDSRVFGPVTYDRIKGKLFLRFWPPAKFTIY